MSGIAGLTVEQFEHKIMGFDQSYVQDWNAWCEALRAQENVSLRFGEILRRWQACRPYRMRLPQGEAKHDSPFLENLIIQSNQYIQALKTFDIGHQAALNGEVRRLLEQLWNIFQNLCCDELRNGLASVVGISKAVLLLTEGRVGPAFDKNIRDNLQILKPLNAQQWFDALKKVSKDIFSFEAKNKCTLQEATPPVFADLHSGRIYDMALGPRQKKRKLEKIT